MSSVWSAAASRRDAMADSLRLAPERRLERETGFEPATSTLARSHSTTELFPPFGENSAYHSDLWPIKTTIGRSFAQAGRMIRVLPLCLLALLVAPPARADEVRLKNGD